MRSEQHELMAKGQDFEVKLGARLEGAAEGREQGAENGRHGLAAYRTQPTRRAGARGASMAPALTP